ncbi:hypothetical protein MY11210_005124 [Beauveria gryllotalpidicola]
MTRTLGPAELLTTHATRIGEQEKAADVCKAVPQTPCSEIFPSDHYFVFLVNSSDCNFLFGFGEEARLGRRRWHIPIDESGHNNGDQALDEKNPAPTLKYARFWDISQGASKEAAKSVSDRSTKGFNPPARGHFMSPIEFRHTKTKYNEAEPKTRAEFLTHEVCGYLKQYVSDEEESKHNIEPGSRKTSILPQAKHHGIAHIAAVNRG